MTWILYHEKYFTLLVIRNSFARFVQFQRFVKYVCNPRDESSSHLTFKVTINGISTKKVWITTRGRKYSVKTITCHSDLRHNSLLLSNTYCIQICPLKKLFLQETFKACSWVTLKVHFWDSWRNRYDKWGKCQLKWCQSLCTEISSFDRTKLLHNIVDVEGWKNLLDSTEAS